MSTVIFCFSSTGNSLYVARELARQLDDTKVVPINHVTLKQNHSLPEKVGFVHPVYFVGLPNLVKDFIRSLKPSAATYFFAIATKGGTDMLSANQIDTLLKPHGVKLSYATALAMPDNYQLLYPVLPREKQDRIFATADSSLTKIAEALRREADQPAPAHNPVLAGLGSMLHRKMYELPGGRDRFFHVTDACIHCGICAKVCPVANITMDNGSPRWNHHCQRCLACLQWCPKLAVQYRKATQKKGRYHHPGINVNDIIESSGNT